MSKYKAKGAVRTIKNYTKGYSDIQAKVRSATSNDPWGPSSTLMTEIAQATYTHHEFIEVMEMIDKRLNDHGKNWRHVFKALTLLDYCLRAGSPDVVAYAKENIYVVKTLREFQYIDDEGKDQGANVRQKAKEITSLLQDDERLEHARRQHADMRRRLTGYDDDYTVNRSLNSTPTYDHPGYYDEEADLKKAIEESKKTAQEYERKLKENEDDEELARALRISKEEEEKRQEELKKKLDANQTNLLDLGTSGNNPFSQQADLFGNNSQFGSSSNIGNRNFDPFGSIDNQQTAISYMNQTQYINNPNQIQQQPLLITDPYHQQQSSSQLGFQASNTSIGSNNPFGLFTQQQQQQQQQQLSFGANSLGSFNNSINSTNLTNNPSSLNSSSTFPNNNIMITKPPNEKYANLEAALGNRQDGMDTFGNIGNLRVPVGSGFASSMNLSDSQLPRRSSSTGDITGSTSQSNPFLTSGGYSSLSLNQLSYVNSQQQSNDLFSFNTNSLSSTRSGPTSPYSTNSFSTTSNSNTLIDFGDSGSISSSNQLSKNPFQIQQSTPNSNTLSGFNNINH